MRGLSDTRAASAQSSAPRSLPSSCRPPPLPRAQGTRFNSHGSSRCAHRPDRVSTHVPADRAPTKSRPIAPEYKGRRGRRARLARLAAVAPPAVVEGVVEVPIGAVKVLVAEAEGRGGKSKKGGQRGSAGRGEGKEETEAEGQEGSAGRARGGRCVLKGLCGTQGPLPRGGCNLAGCSASLHCSRRAAAQRRSTRSRSRAAPLQHARPHAAAHRCQLASSLVVTLRATCREGAAREDVA